MLSFTVTAPGKVILHGEHSVVYKKLALAASLGLKTRLKFEKLPAKVTNSPKLLLNFKAIDLETTYDLNKLQELLPKEPQTDQEQFFKAKILEVFKFQIETSSTSAVEQQALQSFLFLFVVILNSDDIQGDFDLRVTISTDLTVSAGLGSSASFLVTVAAALVTYKRIVNWQRCNQNSVGGDLERFGKLTQEDLMVISNWGYEAEKIIHGMPSGVDNTTCTFGAIVAFRKNTEPKPVALKRDLKVLLINTMVPKNTKMLVKKVRDLKEKYPAAIAATLDAMDAVACEALQCFTELLGVDSTDSDVKTGYEKLGELSEINQHLLTALTVSHPKIDDICAILRQSSLSGKLTGAGGGGYVIAIVPPQVTRETIAGVTAKLTANGYQVIETELGGAGVEITMGTA